MPQTLDRQERRGMPPFKRQRQADGQQTARIIQIIFGPNPDQQPAPDQ
jgi:hypothetical protein